MSNISGAQDPVVTTGGGGGGGGNVNVTQVASGNVATTGVTGEQLVGIAGATGAALDVAEGGASSPANALQVAGAVNVPPPALSSGQSAALQLNAQGALLTAGQTPTEVTAAWTSATAGNTALALTVLGYASVVVTINQGTTLTGGIVTFEVSDTVAFTNAYGIKTTNNGVVNQGVVTFFSLAPNTNSSFTFNIAGWAAFRVRLSTVINGTATVNVGIQACALPNNNDIPEIGNISNVVSANVRSVLAATALADNQANTNWLPSNTSVAGPVSVGDWVYGGAFSGSASASLQGWSKARTATVFKTVQATASGNTAVWTPGSGNKFRLLQFKIQVTGNATLSVAGVLTVSFQDSASATNIAMDIYVPSSAQNVMQGYDSGWIDLGRFGFLSAAANNALNVNLSVAVTAGNVRVFVTGTEE